VITECAADLLARVRTVPALAGANTGLAIGGKALDPGLLKKAPPFAWVLYAGEAPYTSAAQGGAGLIPNQEEMLTTWRVVVYVPYTTDDDLLNTQYPLLESVALAVKSTITTGPIGGTESPNGYRWRYVGQKLALVYADRLGYEQHYTLQAVF
jgi:hypothetical protein